MYKWNKIAPPLSIGSLVLMVDERYHPSKLRPLSRIIRTHQGRDGFTRVVTIRTQTTLKRLVTKVCPLPLSQDTL